ncbi:DUF1330 domain-containing protein [Vibrio parahaemolyticus]|uniref:DUF1330 domain-containing protein n=1 Tax=Vibrio parahaemolyticus TaxID=670 RepID=UPI00111DD56F|nr:DUF1330 domain-containing protein [Vibrio parahaemolyticus]TOP86013.1 hypothetical protein CGH07_23845 [Vibrio parahaemolyticus]
MNQEKPAYFIFDVKIHDPEGMKPYGENVEATYKRFGGRRIVFNNQVMTWDGASPQGHLIILKFDDIEQAKAWHNSPEYQEIIQYRHAFTNTNAWLVEGVFPEFE